MVYNYDIMITDFCVGLANNKKCGTGITEADMITHLKKLNKSNGIKRFSITVYRKYLKYIKGEFLIKEIPVEVLEDTTFDYRTIYNDACIIYSKF